MIIPNPFDPNDLRDLSSTNTYTTGAVYEPNADNSGSIKYVITGTEADILAQNLPPEHAIAFTDMVNVGPSTHLVVKGVVKSMADVLALLAG